MTFDAKANILIEDSIKDSFPDFSFSTTDILGHSFGQPEAGTEPDNLDKRIQHAIGSSKTCLYSSHRFKPQICFFDMDATVIKEESIVVLAESAGQSQRVAQITEDAMQGRISFKEALRSRVELLAGLPSSVITETHQKLTLQPGIEPLCSWLKHSNIPYYLVSGGFHQLADKIAADLGFSGVRANRLGVADGKLTGKVEGEIITGAKKAEYLNQTVMSAGKDRSAILSVGDGANDRAMMQESALTIGFSPKKALIPYLLGANYSGDHLVLLEFLKKLS